MFRLKVPVRFPEESFLQRWEPLAQHLAKRFEGTAEREDLEQIARLALWQAACRFDPARGCSFTTYAFVTIAGTLKRYVRDQARGGGIPRRWWELRPRLAKTAESLARTLGRDPTIPELAAHVGVSEEDVAGAMEVPSLRYPVSLDEISGGLEEERGMARSERIAAPDPRLEAVERRLVVRDALEGLPPRLQEILRRRYFESQSQDEVGRALGISQMHVSRLERKALAHLRQELQGTWGARRE